MPIVYLPIGAPPDYFSIFEQIQELRAENTNHFVFFRKAGFVLLSTGEFHKEIIGIPHFSYNIYCLHDS